MVLRPTATPEQALPSSMPSMGIRYCRRGGGGVAGECSSKGPSVEQARQFTHTRWHCLFRDTKKRQTSTAGAAAEQTPGCVLACGSYQGDTCTTSASPKVMIALLTRPSTPSTCRQTGRQTKPPGANGRQIGD